MAHGKRHPTRPRRTALSGPLQPRLAGDSLSLDLLRARLYRLLDEIAGVEARRHRDLVREFERAWETYKEATAGRS
jgi:hypothetical protein